MFTDPWYLALKLQLLITIAAMLVGKAIFRLSWIPLLFAGLFCFSVPVAQPPGFLTWLLPMDLAAPLIFLLAIFLLSIRCPSVPERRLIQFFLIVLFFWPLVTAMLYVLTGAPNFYWVTSLWRKLLKVSLFIIGLRWGYNRLEAREFMDSVALIWIGMAIVGIMQIFGILDVDFHSPHAGILKILSILYAGEAAQRGFLGLDHGSVGLFGSGLSAYYLIILLSTYKKDKKDILLYILTITISLTVVFISGTRTGLIACVVGVLYSGYYLLRLQYFNKIFFSVLVACMILIFLGISFKPLLLSSGSRYTKMRKIEDLGSWQFRVRMWKRTLEYVSNHPRVFLFGLGEGSQGTAGNTIGIGNTHNEYLQNLIDTGVIGFFLYIGLLVTIYSKLGGRYERGSPILQPENEGMRAAMVTGLVCALTVAFLTNTALKKMSYSCVFFLSVGALISKDRQRLSNPCSFYVRKIINPKTSRKKNKKGLI